MTIELITGTPGSGKTTFAVAMRIAPESKRQVQLDDDTCLKLGLDLGTTVTRRVVAAGVRGLKIEHERLPHLLTKDATPAAVVDEWNSMETDGRGKETDVPVHKRVAGEPPLTGIECVVQNWWLWAMPGDLIVVDEAQFLAPRGTLGRKRRSPARLAAYMSKYMLKGFEEGELFANRYSASEQVGLPKPQRMEFTKVSLAELVGLVYDEVAVGGVEIFNWLSRFGDVFYIATEPDRPRELRPWEI